MIQLATDPHASRLNWRPAPQGKDAAATAPKTRSGHAWPFISRAAERPAGPQVQPPPRHDHGS